MKNKKLNNFKNNFYKFNFEIDSSDWASNEKERDLAVDYLINAVNKLSERNAALIAAFLLAESKSDGEFEFHNGIDNEYVDELSNKVHSMQSQAFLKATKKWGRTPDVGHNLFLYVK